MNNHVVAKIEFDGRAFEVAYRVRETSGPWIILIHGLQSNGEIFDPFFKDDSLSGYSLLAIDLIGFGKSSKPKDFSYDLAAQTKIMLLLTEKLEIKSFTLVGHSVGGMVATLALDLAPTRLTSIVSLKGNLLFSDCGESAEVSKLSFEDFRRTFLSRIQKIRDGEPTCQRRYKALTQIPDNAFYLTAKSIVSWSRTGQLFNIFQTTSHPKLLIRGSKSSYSSVPHGPSVQISQIEGAGHFMLLEKPDETITLVAQFMKTRK